MATANHEKEVKNKEESSLIGTALGVGFVGVVIFVSYIALYGLYMARV